MPQKHISFVGLPGSGKSTIGRQVARHIGLVFVDADHAIEQYLGCTIRDYFAQQGEEAFRQVEARILQALLEQPQRQLIATGGGIVLRPENRQALRQHSTVVYLQALPEEIARRLRGDTVRPLLQGVDALQRLRDLLKVRGSLYREVAHYVIDTQRQSTGQVARKITMQLEVAGLLPIPAPKPVPKHSYSTHR